MKTPVFGIALAALALTATSALAENAVGESQKKLDKAFGQTAQVEAPAAQTAQESTGFFGGIFDRSSRGFPAENFQQRNGWGDNYAAGRAHAPAGR